MRSILRFLGSRWFLTFIGVALLAAVVWFFAPLISVFEPWWVRLIIVAVMLLVWAGLNLLIDRRRRNRDRILTADVTKVDASQAASAEELAALREKLTTALGTLKKARGKSGYLYEQPWYVIIGPPGAGKTTALLNAGLRFPLAAEMGQASVAGVGGTRMCDWWFTEDAVLIDTAGRYTTQDSDANIDRAGWTGFLDLLKRTRVRQPLNGVIVAIALSDIAAAPQSERLAHARAIRRRIKEITERLSLRVPIYAVFTKADLIAGFSEFFDDLDRERRAQVWGTTFARDAKESAPGAGPVSGFVAEFRALVERLNVRLFDRLQAERSPDRRAMLAGFPAQVASLESPLTEFLMEGFGGSRMDPAPFLRGVYMASGTQEGTPIDRLTGVLSRAFGLDQRRAPSLRPEQGRSYFLGRLLKDVIFNEAMLVSHKPGAARRRLFGRIGGYALAAVAVLLCSGLLWQIHSTNQHEIDESAAALGAYEAAARPISVDPVTGGNLAAVLPALDQARALPHGYDTHDGISWWSLGLSQTEKLGTGARLIYRHALERLLLPRLLARLEAQMRGSLNRPDFLYEATRVYLMLGNQGPMDRDLVTAWMGLDWQASYSGPAAGPLREGLAKHLVALLDAPLPSIPLDGALVAAARATFSRVPVAERVYSRIRPSTAAQRIPPWRPSDALGAAGVRVFVRPSGKALTDGVPGFFTVDGLHKVLLPALGHVARDVAAESWVLGERAALDTSGPQLRQLERDVITLYTNDYAKQWDAMLSDLNVVPLRNLTQASQDLYILGSPQSPMRDLLASASKQLAPSIAPPPPPGLAGAAAAATTAATTAASSAQSQLQGLLGNPDNGPPPDPPGFVIDQRYKLLRDFVGTGPGAPIDVVLKLVNDLQAQLAHLAATPTGGPAAPPIATGADPAQILRTEALRQPQPVSRWLQDMASSSIALRGGGARQQVADVYNGGGGGGGAPGAAGGGGGGSAASPAGLCKQAVTGRYPFSVGATNEIPMDDFGRLFAPGGLLDGFFNTQLRAYVDMSGTTWKPQPLDGVPAPVAPDQLVQFQRAAVIRDLFFAAGGNAPSVRFDITPTTLDNGARQVTLDLDGLTVSNVHGPTRATQVTWPGTNRMQNVRLIFDPPSSGATGVFTATGPWALFRLFGQGSLVQAGSPELYTLSFRQGDRQAAFEIRAGSVLNPFAPGVLQEFRCPTLP